MLESVLRQKTKFADQCRADAAFFSHHILGAELYEKQIEIMTAVATKRKVAVRSGHAVGKTFTCAHLVLWFLYTRPGSIVLTLSPTEVQGRDVLWREIRRAHAEAKWDLGGEVQSMRINLGEKWYAVGRATRESTNLQGYHAPDQLVVIDEAPGIQEHIWPAIHGITTGSGSHIVAIGNPTRADGMFFDVCTKPKLGWHSMQLSCFDTPNVKSGEEVIPGLATLEWVQERAAEYGEESNLFRTRVLGEFPEEGDSTLFRMSLVDAAVHSPRHEDPLEGPVRIGVDIARKGGDSCVAVVRQGARVISIEEWSGRQLMHTVGRIQSIMSKYPGIIHQNVVVDAGSLGSGVFDRLKELGINVRGVNFGQAAFDKRVYADWKSEAYAKLQREFEQGEIAIPNHGKLLRDLQNIQIAEYKSDGKMRLVSKEEMRKKGVPSPDFSDGLVLASGYVRQGGKLEMPRDPESVNRMIQEAIWRRLDPTTIEAKERKKSKWKGIKLA